jgi:hypothetical protein
LANVFQIAVNGEIDGALFCPHGFIARIACTACPATASQQQAKSAQKGKDFHDRRVSIFKAILAAYALKGRSL